MAKQSKIIRQASAWLSAFQDPQSDLDVMGFLTWARASHEHAYIFLMMWALPEELRRAPRTFDIETLAAEAREYQRQRRLSVRIGALVNRCVMALRPRRL